MKELANLTLGIEVTKNVLVLNNLQQILWWAIILTLSWPLFTHSSSCWDKFWIFFLISFFKDNLVSREIFSSSSRHCCIVVHINVLQHQNIFCSWMNRPLDDSSRRIIPVQIWELLHTCKYFVWIKNLNLFFSSSFCCNFDIFFEFLETLLSNLTMKKRKTKKTKNTQV